MVPDGKCSIPLRLTTCLAVVPVVGLCLQPAPFAAAHPQLMTCVRHRVTMSVGRKNVDVTVELTIGEIPAHDERRLMDGDRNGAVTRDEVGAYLNEKHDVFQQSVGLTMAGKPVELMCLYEPEIDLLGDESVLESQLILRLFYFARTPTRLITDDQIVFTDRLWPLATGIGSYHVTGQDGVETAAERSASVLRSSPREAAPLTMCARCLAVAGVIRSDPRVGPTRATVNAVTRVESTSLSQSDSSDQDARSALVPCATLAALIASAAVLVTRRVQRQRKRKIT